MLLLNATCKLQTKVVVAIKIVINDELALVVLSYLGFIFQIGFLAGETSIVVVYDNDLEQGWSRDRENDDNIGDIRILDRFRPSGR
jgi:hypothetical protein